METHPLHLQLPLGLASSPERAPSPTPDKMGPPRPLPQPLTLVAVAIVVIGLVLSLVPAFLYSAHPVAYLRAAANGAGSTTTASLGLSTAPEHRYRNQAQPNLDGDDPQVAQPVLDSGGRPLEAP